MSGTESVFAEISEQNSPLSDAKGEGGTGSELDRGARPDDDREGRLRNPWYGRRSVLNRSLYKIMKTLTIASAAVIPVLTTSSIPYGTRIAAGLGVLIAVIEGIQQLNHYQANWASYRTAAETLKHEKYRFLCRIGPYSKTSNPYSMLAERVESIISQETEKWLTGEAQTAPNYSTRTARHN